MLSVVHWVLDGCTRGTKMNDLYTMTMPWNNETKRCKQKHIVSGRGLKVALLSLYHRTDYPIWLPVCLDSARGCLSLALPVRWQHVRCALYQM